MEFYKLLERHLHEQKAEYASIRGSRIQVCKCSFRRQQGLAGNATMVHKAFSIVEAVIAVKNIVYQVFMGARYISTAQVFHS